MCPSTIFFLVGRQYVKALFQLPPQHAEDSLLPSLWDKHHVIFAVPSRVAQASSRNQGINQARDGGARDSEANGFIAQHGVLLSEERTG
jgi:hypothetical protein